MTFKLKGDLWPAALVGMEVEIVPENGPYPLRDRLVTIRFVDEPKALNLGYSGDVRVPPSCIEVC